MNYGENVNSIELYVLNFTSTISCEKLQHCCYRTVKLQRHLPRRHHLEMTIFIVS